MDKVTLGVKSLIWIAFLLPFSANAQKLTYSGFPSTVWPVLYAVDYEKGNDQFGEFAKPVFNQKIKGLSGKKIALPGYMVPFESGLSAQEFMLSSLPLNACFFCGVGGPETVVQVRLTRPVKYSDKPVEVRGILRLNEDDPDNMMYILENAELLGEIDF